MEYKAIIKRASDDELRHWKYIKRVKMHNGKWKYIYDPEQELTKYKNGFSETKRYNHYDFNEGDHPKKQVVKDRTTYKQTDNWLDNTTTIKARTVGNDVDYTTKQTTHYQGKLSRAAAKGEKWIFDNLISNKKKTASQRKKKKK